jgi:FkbM family methyltransferase
MNINFEVVVDKYRQDGFKSLLSAIMNRIEHNIRESQWRIQRKDELELNYKDVDVKLDTSSKIAKNWLFPRYIDGDLHEPGLTKYLLESLQKDDVFYDVGANVGYFAAFASAVCDGGRIHIFELDENLIEINKSHFKLNRNSAIFNHVAVSDIDDDSVTHPVAGPEATVPHLYEESSVNGESVQTITLGTYIKSHDPPDVMKIDVDGFEYRVLKGAKSLLKKGHPRILLLELHPEYIIEFGNTIYDVLDLLEDIGYHYYYLDHEREDIVLTPVEKSQLREMDLGTDFMIVASTNQNNITSPLL